MRISILLAFSVILTHCGRGKKNAVHPTRMDITETVFASGSLEPRYVYNLTAQTDGILVRLNIDAGDTLPAGALAAVIDNRQSAISAESARELARIAELNALPGGPVLSQARQSLELAEEKMRQDSIQWRRFEGLEASKSVSKLEAENARLAYISSRTAFQNAKENVILQERQARQQLIAQRSQSDISAATGGYNEVRIAKPGKVYRLAKEAGDFVRRGELIAVIGDPERMYAKLHIDENNVGRVKPGQGTVIELNSGKGKTYKAVVRELLPAFEESTQSFICEAEFIDKPDFRVAGTQLQANIVTARKKNRLVIPRAYLGYGGAVNVKGRGKVQVQTGFISGEWVEILGGLTVEDELTLR